MREKLIALLGKYFDIGDSYAYNLTRVKTAFEVGTMSFEDFEEFDEETITDLADYLIENGVDIQPCKVGDKVYQTDTDGVRVYESTIKNVIYVTEGVSFDENAIGKSIFLTREDAEKESEE